MAKVESNVSQLSFRIEAALHKSLKLHVIREETTVGKFVAEAVREKMDRDKKQRAKSS